MAKVVSLFQIRGTIGDLTFRQTASGTVAQQRPGPTREQVLTSDRFKNTRRNAGEFKVAIRDAKLLRHALGSAIDSVRHSLLNGQMNKLLRSVSKRDMHSDFGFRHAGMGDVRLLAGFDFNHQLLLDQALPVKFEHSLDATTGTLRLEVPSFIARRKKEFPAGATHFRIVSCGAVVSFLHGSYTNDIKASELLPLGKKTPGPICLEHKLHAGPGEVLVQVMGMEFYSVVNGKKVLLKSGAMRILSATRIKEELYELMDMPATDTEVKPYRAKELRQVGMVIVQMPLSEAPVCFTQDPGLQTGVSKGLAYAANKDISHSNPINLLS